MAQTLSGTIIGNGNIYASPTTKPDTALSDTSTNAVQNKVITVELNKLSSKITTSSSSDDFFIKDIDNDIVLNDNPTTSKLFVVDADSDIVLQN